MSPVRICKYIFVVSTSIPAGKPISAGISNASRERTKVRINTANTLGRASGKVTLRNTCQLLLPAASAASSKVGSIERNGVAINRNTTGVQTNASTIIIPDKEKTSNNGETPVRFSATTLTIPASGSQHEYPADDFDDAGNTEGDERGNISDALTRRVGALGQPGEQSTDQ